MSDTKRLILWVSLVAWAFFSLVFPVHAQQCWEMPYSTYLNNQSTDCDIPIEVAANTIVVKKRAVVSAGAPATTYHCDDGTHDGAANVVLLCEDFDGSVNCRSGADAYCRVTWGSDAGAWPTFNGTVIDATEGTYSSSFVGNALDRIYKSFTAGSPIYVFFRMKVGAVANQASPPILYLYSGALAENVKINLNYVNASAFTLTAWHGTTNGGAGANLSSNTLYNVWIEYTKDPGGSTGTLDIYVSSTSTKGSAYKSITTGQASTDVAYLAIGTGNIAPITYDHIRVKSSSDSGVPN